MSDQTNRPVICEYKADGAWLWRKWRGTVLSITLVPVLVSMGFGVAIDLAARFGCDATWPLLAVPPPEEELIQSLNGINTLWEYQLTLSTFILTFFTQVRVRVRVRVKARVRVRDHPLDLHPHPLHAASLRLLAGRLLHHARHPGNGLGLGLALALALALR